MNRRRFLAAGLAAVGTLPGCQSGPDSRSHTGSGAATTTDTASASTTATARESPDRIVVSPDGADSNPGTSDAPVGSVQEALDRAGPGTTVSLTPGVHTQGDPDRPVGITRRPGTADRPIRIVGPPEAVVRGPPAELSSKPLFHITHSHVSLQGMTLDGLTNPGRGDDHRWYRQELVDCSPPTWEASYPDYLTDVKITPRAAGNAREKLISSWRTNDLEIGGFEVTGPAGVDHFLGDEDGYVLGAVVSLGRSSNNFGTSWYPWEGPDESHGIRVHHILQREGHPHTELVKFHAGNYDATVEYCTDTGGMTRSGVRLAAGQSTVRWCVLSNSPRNGVSVAVPAMRENGAYDAFSDIPESRFPGRNNAIYGNRLEGNADGAIGFSSPDWFETGPGHQEAICENDTGGDSQTPCSGEVPDGAGTGHTGGDGPWSS